MRATLAFASPRGQVFPSLASTSMPLYIRRDVLNADEIIEWAKRSGFKTTLTASDMHVTCAHSRAPVDWLACMEGSEHDHGIACAPSNERLVSFLGDKGGIVLKFTSSLLMERWARLGELGCSWDWPSYQPHVTLTYSNPDGLEPAKVKPYEGAIMLGPEIFEPLDTDWNDKVAENALDYSVIAGKLDALEARGIEELRGALEESRDALLARVRRSSDMAALVRDTRRLPRFGGIQAEVRAMLGRAWEAGQAAARSEVRVKALAGTESSFSPAAAARWLRAHSFWVAGILGDRVLADSKAAILSGLKTGKSTAQIMDDVLAAFLPWLGAPGVIRDEKQLEPYRLETIVRTNNTTAYNHGRLTEFVDKDVVRFLQGVKYSAILDTRTTEVCKFLDGKIFKPGSPDLEALLPPNHYNAVVKGTLIKTARGDLPIEQVDVDDQVLTHRGRWRRVYAVMSKRNASYLELHLSTGRILRVTEEHPILLSKGWSRADGAKIGDQLFQHSEESPRPGSVSVGSPKDFPSLFDEEAVSYEHIRFSRCASLPVVDFEAHAQGGPREVKHKTPDRMLESEGVSVKQEQRGEVGLCFGWLLTPRQRSALCHLFHAAVGRIVSSAHALAGFLGPRIGLFALAPSPVVTAGALGYGLGGSVGNGDLLRAGAYFDTETVARSVKRALSHSERTLYGAYRFPVTPMPVVDQGSQLSVVHGVPQWWVGAAIIAAIKVGEETEVWNLAVEEDETYHADGIVVHNCRSIVVPVVLGETVNEKQFITAAEVGRAKSLADAKFLAAWGNTAIFSLWSREGFNEDDE